MIKRPQVLSERNGVSICIALRAPNTNLERVLILVDSTDQNVVSQCHI